MGCGAPLPTCRRPRAGTCALPRSHGRLGNGFCCGRKTPCCPTRGLRTSTPSAAVVGGGNDRMAPVELEGASCSIPSPLTTSSAAPSLPSQHRQPCASSAGALAAPPVRAGRVRGASAGGVAHGRRRALGAAAVGSCARRVTELEGDVGSPHSPELLAVGLAHLNRRVATAQQRRLSARMTHRPNASVSPPSASWPRGGHGGARPLQGCARVAAATGRYATTAAAGADPPHLQVAHGRRARWTRLGYPDGRHVVADVTYSLLTSGGVWKQRTIHRLLLIVVSYADHVICLLCVCVFSYSVFGVGLPTYTLCAYHGMASTDRGRLAWPVFFATPQFITLYLVYATNRRSRALIALYLSVVFH